MFLARSVNRLDFWNIPNEMNPAEFAVWRAEYELEPWGEDRADQRHAMNTTMLMVSQSGKTPDESAIEDTLKTLQVYTPAKRAAEEDRYSTPNEVFAIIDGA